MIVLAAVGGSMVGILEVNLGHRVYVLAGGLLCLIVILIHIGRYCVWHPIELFSDQLVRIEKSQSLPRNEHLPTERRDEIGQIARTIKHLIGMNIRDAHEARQLRRTIDHRVTTAIRKATRNLEQLANRDPLTGLGNRRYIDDMLPELVDSSLSSGTELTCMVMDMDNFKQVNDTLGHAVGDELLTFVASLIKSSVRANDCPIRLGGDEFVVLMPGCTLETAQELAERLRSLFKQHATTAYGGAGGVGLSMGLASLSEYDIHNGKDLVEVADRRLYVAKRSGKGRAVGA